MAEMLVLCVLRCILICYLDMRVMAEMLISCVLRCILICYLDMMCYLGMRVYG